MPRAPEAQLRRNLKRPAAINARPLLPLRQAVVEQLVVHRHPRHGRAAMTHGFSDAGLPSTGTAVQPMESAVRGSSKLSCNLAAHVSPGLRARSLVVRALRKPAVRAS